MTERDPALTPVRLSARQIPPPSTISPAAQKILSDSTSVARIKWPPADDLEAWRKQLATTNATREQMALSMLAGVRANIETKHIAGVLCYDCTPIDPAAIASASAVAASGTRASAFAVAGADEGAGERALSGSGPEVADASTGASEGADGRAAAGERGGAGASAGVGGGGARGAVNATARGRESGGAVAGAGGGEGAGAGGVVYLFMHGGAFVVGGGTFAKAQGARYAAAIGVRTVSVDYRMPPDHPFPAAPEDCVAVYKALIETTDPKRVVIGGSSAGGNLAAAATLMIRDQGLPLPAGVVLLTPEADLTESGDTFRTNADIDVVIKGGFPECNALYANGHDLRDPYLSPVFADFTKGFPPTLVQSGTRDLFLSNSVRMHRKLRDAGVDAELHVWEAMPHGGFIPGEAPENAEIQAEVARFIRRVVG
jgi:acetyl esterase/lipase